LRNRELIATPTYSSARITAALTMKIEDLRLRGAGWLVCLHQKGGKHHMMPRHHALAETLLGFPELRFHDLRRTHETMLLDAGVPVHAVAARCGHDPAVLLRVYAKRTRKADTSAASPRARLPHGLHLPLFSGPPLARLIFCSGADIVSTCLPWIAIRR
jgi:integrase